MPGLLLEWDERKAAANLRKHKVGFSEAETTFADPFSLDWMDVDHSQLEDRFIKLARAASGRVLIVAYTERGNRIRIISARKANPQEARRYEEPFVQ